MKNLHTDDRRTDDRRTTDGQKSDLYSEVALAKNIESNTNFNDSKDILVTEDIFKKTKATFTRFTNKFLTKAIFTNLSGNIHIK